MWKTNTNPSEIAATLAFRAIAYLAGNEDYLGRFLALSGVAPSDLRTGLQDPAFQGAILDFFLQDEALLLAFCADQAIPPREVAMARHHLPGATQ